MYTIKKKKKKWSVQSSSKLQNIVFQELVCAQILRIPINCSRTWSIFSTRVQQGCGSIAQFYLYKKKFVHRLTKSSLNYTLFLCTCICEQDFWPPPLILISCEAQLNFKKHSVEVSKFSKCLLLKAFPLPINCLCLVKINNYKVVNV